MELFKHAAISSALLLSLSGCGGSDSDNPTAPTTAKFSLGVSDAPVDGVSSVTVAYKRVVLIPQGGGTDIEFDLSDEDDNAQLVDLLDYQGSQVAPLLTDKEIPAGDYKLCLFVIDGDGQDQTSHVMVGDAPGTLAPLEVKGNGSCPGSGKEEGAGVLYFNKSFTVNNGNNSFVTEFELRRGLKEKNGAYTIQRTSVQLMNNTEAGNIKGTIDSNIVTTCTNSSEDSINAVYVYSGDVALADMAAFNDTTEGAVLPVASAGVKVNADDTNIYEYEVAFLGEGSYSLGYTCQAQKDLEDAFDATFTIDKVESASVVAKETTEVDFAE